MYTKNEFAGKTIVASSEQYEVGRYLNECDCLPGCFGIVRAVIGDGQYEVNHFYRREKKVSKKAHADKVNVQNILTRDNWKED